MTTLTDAERIAWLRLARTENVGPVTFRYLLARFGGASAALAALPELAQRSGRRKLRVASLAEARRELEQVNDAAGQVIALCEPAYPEALVAIEDAPPLLFLRGRIDVLQCAGVGVVGARNASGNGRGGTGTIWSLAGSDGNRSRNSQGVTTAASPNTRLEGNCGNRTSTAASMSSASMRASVPVVPSHGPATAPLRVDVISVGSFTAGDARKLTAQVGFSFLS